MIKILEDIFWPVREFFRKIVKIFTYIPIIWNNEDYDIDSCIELFCYKLKRTSEYFNKYGHIVGSKKIASDMLKTEKLLIKSLDEDNYCKEDYKKHEKRWGKLRCNGKDWKGSSLPKTEFFGPIIEGEKTMEWAPHFGEDDRKWCCLTGHDIEDVIEDLKCSYGKMFKGYYPKAKNAKEQKQAGKDLFKIMKKQQQLMERDMKLAMKEIVKNRNEWVD